MTQESDRENNFSRFRSPNLLNAESAALIVIDVQEILMPYIIEGARLTWNLTRLIRGADALSIPARATEQYPAGLGPTVPTVKKLIEKNSEEIPDKSMFSCRECVELVSGLADRGVRQLVLAGIETHICVAQSAMDLMGAGFQVFVCVDAVSARSPLDHETALRRLENNGVVPTTTEAVLFEWCETSDREEFQTISALVREQFQ